MHVLTKLGAAAVVWATVVSSAYAQQYHPYLPDTGTKEIGFSASVNWEPADSQSIFGRFGYFFNRNFELGIDASWNNVENQGGGHSDFWDAGVFANFNIPTSTPWLPYIGLFGGYADGSNIDGSASWGAQGGAKYFFNPNVAGFAELRWRDLEKGDNQFGIFFGLSIFFR
jgi:hypothetical protein